MIKFSAPFLHMKPFMSNVFNLGTNLSRFTRVFLWVKFSLKDLLCVNKMIFRNSVVMNMITMILC